MAFGMIGMTVDVLPTVTTLLYALCRTSLYLVVIAVIQRSSRALLSTQLTDTCNSEKWLAGALGSTMKQL
jgi:hypothetical protein